MNRRQYIALFVAALLATGCATYAPYERAKHSDFINANYVAADRLIATSQLLLSPNTPIIMATLVRLDNLEQSSNLGRLISEQVSSRFTQRNYSIVELKLRGTVFVKASEGFLLLSRELRDIANSHSAQAVVVGTYAVGRDYVFVNLKLIGAVDNRVIASYDYQLPTVEVRTLL